MAGGGVADAVKIGVGGGVLGVDANRPAGPDAEQPREQAPNGSDQTPRRPRDVFAADGPPDAAPASGNDNFSLPPELGPAGEIECLRHVLSPGVLAAAERRAAVAGVGADRVLIEAGVIGEDAYLRYLSRHTRIDLVDADASGLADGGLRPEQYISAARSGLLPIGMDGQLVWLVAPRGHAARRIAALVANSPDTARILRLATAAAFHAIILRLAGDVLTRKAFRGLGDYATELTAAPRPRPKSGARLWVPSLLAVPPVVLFPLAAFETAAAALAIWFLAFVALRLAASLTPRRASRPLPRLPDDRLPAYTIIAALYREAGSVGDLVRAIRSFDYPREKLDIKLVVEADDLETRAAIARLENPSNLQVIVAVDDGPRTKPKALNCALPFARGSFTVIYDAEDRPEPDQLRAALDAFRRNGEDVACAQASLCIDNPSDSWLSRMFTAEYAGQFDVFLPGFAKFRLPLPLGGSSNHFRTRALRHVVGWDAFNVTEDADLGVRLARFGYRSVVFASTTYEEAPARFGAWLRQRTRWMKGWMQTWAVHMRSPRQLWRDLGPRGFLAMNVAIGGGVLTALVHPFFVAEMATAAAAPLFGKEPWVFASALAPLHQAAIAAGYLAAIFIGAVGLCRRGLFGSLWVLALIPIYWLCLSLAAWRALIQLIRDPYHWEKTEHGLARSSRFVAVGLRDRDRPEDETAVRNGGAVPRPRRRAAA
jgi:cellulose synthase/poly-beta-1,6-N-acetylglucosamine synthase-like glycosyltransferase